MLHLKYRARSYFVCVWHETFGSIWRNEKNLIEQILGEKTKSTVILRLPLNERCNFSQSVSHTVWLLVSFKIEWKHIKLWSASRCGSAVGIKKNQHNINISTFKRIVFVCCASVFAVRCFLFLYLAVTFRAW